ncbi:MAG: hypothetical protein M3214_03130 [Actinomycetota bacterium]|nr:hypothetical protein [Actinomycetota bacterium]
MDTRRGSEGTDIGPRDAVVVVDLKTLKRRIVKEKSTDAPRIVGIGGPPLVAVNSQYVAFTDETGFFKSIGQPRTIRSTGSAATCI